MQKVTHIAGAVLSGGKNTRIGGINKAYIKVKETYILSRTVSILKDIFDEIIIVTNNPKEYKQLNNKYIIITDTIKNIGPLGGIHSALLHTNKEAVFFAACDMPYLHNEIIQKQISIFNNHNCDAVIPRIGPHIEPLHAIYRKNIINKIDLLIKDTRNYSVRNLLNVIDVRFLDLEENNLNRKVFTNINTPEDLEKIKKCHEN